MIGRLTGRLAECGPEQVLLDVGGVGYQLSIPLSTFYELSGRNGPVTLHVHTHVREDALLLYGFASPEERSVFTRLLGVSGVGPRTALAVLSGIGAAEFERALLEEDRARLERIPGLGRKTVERILLELKDRPPAAGRTRRPAPGPVPAGTGVRSDALSALVNLGYPLPAAVRAVDESLQEGGPDTALEPVLKSALRRLVR